MGTALQKLPDNAGIASKGKRLEAKGYRVQALESKPGEQPPEEESGGQASNGGQRSDGAYRRFAKS